MQPTLKLVPDAVVEEESNDDYVAETFGHDGHLARVVDGYGVREGQLEMVYAISATMDEGGQLMVEAPTGVGKSAAYSVPATRMASLKGEKVVIVTANIVLLEQVYGKDLKLLSEVLPWKFEYALAKGLNNYLCKSRLDDATADILVGKVDLGRDRDRWRKIEKWSTETEKGDISELDFEPKRLLPLFTTTSEDCAGKKCGFFEECHGMRARRVVQNADVIVTNYHLFFPDLILKSQKADSHSILPVYDHVVMDEVHEAYGIASDFLGFRISRGSIKNAVRLLHAPASESSKKGSFPSIDEGMRNRVESHVDRLFADLGRYFEKGYDVRFQEEGEAEGLDLMADALEDARAKMASKTAVEWGMGPKRVEEFEKAKLNLARLVSRLRAAFELYDGERRVYFLERFGEHVVLKCKVVDVATWLGPHFFDVETEGAFRPKSITMTSATITTGPDDFRYMMDKLGVDDLTCETMSVESPFDIPGKAQLVVPQMPMPNDRQFPARVADELIGIFRVVRLHGGLLALFTSKRVLDHAYEVVSSRNESEGWGWTVMRQYEAPRSVLVERFKQDGHAILFGTRSFWTGVDVKGPALSCVVMDKIPFPNIGDPVEHMLKESMGNRYFFDHSVPAATLQFVQGAGRLIRSVNDRGLIVSLDRRVVDKGYGKAFVRALPSGLEVKKSSRAVGEFFSGLSELA